MAEIVFRKKIFEGHFEFLIWPKSKSAHMEREWLTPYHYWKTQVRRIRVQQNLCHKVESFCKVKILSNGVTTEIYSAKGNPNIWNKQKSVKSCVKHGSFFHWLQTYQFVLLTSGSHRRRTLPHQYSLHIKHQKLTNPFSTNQICNDEFVFYIETFLYLSNWLIHIY